MAEDYPFLGKAKQIRPLLDDGLILPVLDGLDEMPEDCMLAAITRDQPAGCTSIPGADLPIGWAPIWSEPALQSGSGVGSE